MECHTDLKKKKISSHVTTRMNPKDIMLGEINQSQEDKYRRILPTWDKVVQFLEMEVMVVRGWGKGKWELLFNELLFNVELQLCKMKKFHRTMMWLYVPLLNLSLKNG